MDPHARAESVWYRVAGLASRNQQDMGVRIIEAEIRSGQYEVLLEAARLVLTDTTPIEIARQLRERAERTADPAAEDGRFVTDAEASSRQPAEVRRLREDYGKSPAHEGGLPADERQEVNRFHGDCYTLWNDERRGLKS